MDKYYFINSASNIPGKQTKPVILRIIIAYYRLDVTDSMSVTKDYNMTDTAIKVFSEKYIYMKIQIGVLANLNPVYPANNHTIPNTPESVMYNDMGIIYDVMAEK